MRDRTRLIRDSAGRYKLHVTLPGGKYQLSLDDGAVNTLKDGLGLDTGDAVPEPFVRVFVATRDAWFPRQRDLDSVIDDLPAIGELTPAERDNLIEYLTTTSVAKRDGPRFKRVVGESPVGDVVGPDDLNVRSLPLAGAVRAPTSEEKPDTRMEQRPSKSKPEQPTQSSESNTTEGGPLQESDLESSDVMEIPGIGVDRGTALVAAGFTSVAQIADSRPADIAEVIGFSDQLATVAVEGARELVGHEEPIARRLAKQTGASEDIFDDALSPLAASGVPPSEAAPILRVLFGPTVADVKAVTGQQAYFLWEAGYQTPADIIHAAIEELEEVRQVGPRTAPDIRDGALRLLSD